MDNLIGFSFSSMILYHYILDIIQRAFNYCSTKVASEEDVVAGGCSVAMSCYLGFLMLNKDFLVDNAPLKLCPFLIPTVVRFWSLKPDFSGDRMDAIGLAYEMAIPAVVFLAMLAVQRLRPHD